MIPFPYRSSLFLVPTRRRSSLYTSQNVGWAKSFSCPPYKVKEAVAQKHLPTLQITIGVPYFWFPRAGVHRYT